MFNKSLVISLFPFSLKPSAFKSADVDKLFFLLIKYEWLVVSFQLKLCRDGIV